MKKILLFILIFISLKSLSQTGKYPNIQTLGSDSTLVESKGGFKGRLINKPFTDTAQANTQRVKWYDGAQIWATTANKLWIRDSTGNKWMEIGAGSGADSITFATQFDISTNRTVIPTFFDTIERRKIYDGVTLLQDFQHPTLLRTATGKILVGAGAAYNHAGGGVTWYGVSLTQGLTWGAPVYVETDTSYHYRNGIFSQKGDTITLTYWSAINGRIYIRRSTDDWVSYGARDSITSAVPLATENRILQWKGYNIMDIYTYTLGTDNIDSAGIAYKTSLTGGVWNFSWIQDLRGLQLDEGKFIVRNDTLFGYIRSDFYQDSMYIVYKTSIAGAWSVPLGIRVPHWDAGKPEILVMDDGRYLMNYRTTLPGGVGAYAISSDNGYTWDSVYNAGGTVYVYGSMLYMGDDTYMNVSSEGVPPYGDLFQLYFHIPRKGLVNSSDFTYESIGRPYTIYKHIWDKMDSTSAGRDIGFPGRLNVVATGAGTNTGLNIFNNVNFGNTALVHSTNALRFLTATHAAPGTQEQRLALFEPTATGTDRVIDIGDDTDPYFRMFQNGTIRSTKPFLNTGPGLFRVENSGGSAPVGAVGAGHEFFAAAGTAYWNTYNRTSSANAPLEIITSATGMTGTVTIKSALKLNPGVDLQFATAGTAGQIAQSNGSGATPSWVNQSTIVGATPTLQQVLTAGATMTGNNLIDVAGNNFTFQNNSQFTVESDKTTGNGISFSGTAVTTGNLVDINLNGTDANSNTQTALNVITQGANANSGQTTYGAIINNGHTGTSSSNVALRLVAASATTNYALIIPPSSGSVGIGTTTPTSTLKVNGSFALGYTGTATGITLDDSHSIVEVTATGQTITLPTAVSVAGRTYTIKLTASGSCTVATTSSQTIDGSTTYSLASQYKYVTVTSNNGNWIVIANN